ncbi:SDR family NAD(P)-dependent oxidoreductase [Mycobacterium sp.]|uniref:SDR family NAD(P)-dependent oxidoreductase n=1 Tax=Mycobacterium sp. TaxID=1785 RepID=UPI0031DAA701
MEINGKKVVVIGGASGMGRATAELLAQRGAEVAVLDRESSDGKSVAEGLGGAFYPVDVTDFTGTEQTLQSAVDKLGGLHVAVTTAGGGIAKRTLTKEGPHDLESFQSVVDLNLVATFNISRLAAAHMARNEPEDPETTGERGVIINTASIAAFEGQIGQIAYTAAKAGIAGMCLTMARDLGSLGIRVLAIAPSLFLTGITSMVPDEMATSLVKDAAFPKRMGRPIEYAKLAAAIVDNPMLNGQCIRLDAGQRFAPK